MKKLLMIPAFLFLIGCSENPQETSYRFERVLVRACINTDFIFEWRGNYYYERTLSSTSMRQVKDRDVCQ